MPLYTRACLQEGAETRQTILYSDFCAWYGKLAGPEARVISGVSFGRKLSALPGVLPAVTGRDGGVAQR